MTAHTSGGQGQQIRPKQDQVRLFGQPGRGGQPPAGHLPVIPPLTGEAGFIRGAAPNGGLFPEDLMRLAPRDPGPGPSAPEDPRVLPFTLGDPFHHHHPSSFAAAVASGSAADPAPGGDPLGTLSRSLAPGSLTTPLGLGASQMAALASAMTAYQHPLWPSYRMAATAAAAAYAAQQMMGAAAAPGPQPGPSPFGALLSARPQDGPSSSPSSPAPTTTTFGENYKF